MDRYVKPGSKVWLKLLKKVPMVYTDVIIKVGKGKVLLGRRTYYPLKGQLCLIGGMVHLNESLKDAALRKVKDETGLKVKLIGIVDVSQATFTKGQSRHGVDFIWLAKKTGGKIKLNNQNSEFVVVDRISNNLAKFVKHALKASKVFEDSKKPNFIEIPFFVEE